MLAEVHPIANAFPMMNAEQFQGLKDDIDERGQQEAIVYWQGQLVDGRNRLKACQEIGIEPIECELDDDADATAYVISANLHRRHLTTAQRSMVAAKLATLKNGSNQHKSKSEGPSNDGPSCRDNAAKLLNVSTASVDRAKHVVANGSKELVQAVERGEVNLNQAVKLTKAVKSKGEQSQVVRKGADAIKAAVAKPGPPPPPKEPSQDDYDYQIVKAFEQCDYRLNTLQRIVQMLEPHERIVLMDFLTPTPNAKECNVSPIPKRKRTTANRR